MLFDTLADLNLCAAVCYIRMCQYNQARESLELILRIENNQTEALLILYWSLTANLVVEHNRLMTEKEVNLKGTTSRFSLNVPMSSRVAREELRVAQECLKLL